MPAKGTHASEETRARVKQNHWTKRDDAQRQITIEVLRQKREQQIHPSLVARGITPEMAADAESKGMVWCSGQCKAFVPGDSFGKNGHGWCRACYAAYMREQRARWPHERRVAQSRFILLKKYGVTPEWESAKLLEQSGVCALCGGPPDGIGVGRPHKGKSVAVNFAVDHDHITGKARGLLCFKCNVALERLESFSGWAEKALAYLARYA